MTKHSRELLVHQPIYRERDLSAEKYRHVDAFLIHIFQPSGRIYHAFAKTPRFVGHWAGNSRTQTLRSGPHTAFEENTRVTLVIFQTNRRLRTPLLRHPRPQIDIAFIDVTVGINHQYVIEIVHLYSLTFHPEPSWKVCFFASEH